MTITVTEEKRSEAKGLKQTDIAELVGVSQQAVSKWLTGSAIPDQDKLKALSSKLTELEIGAAASVANQLEDEELGI